MEATIIINGVRLSNAQSMAVRVAISTMRIGLTDPEGRKALGRIAKGYNLRLSEVENIILETTGK